MPTIQQLPTAEIVNADDQIPVEQNGTTRRVRLETLLDGTQPELTLAQGALLGRVSTMPGSPEPVTLGPGLQLRDGQLELGVDGLTGIPGPQGARGASVLSGNGAPAASAGADGDSYLDRATGDIWTRVGDTWTATGQSLRGPAGPSGPVDVPDAALLSGSGNALQPISLGRGLSQSNGTLAVNFGTGSGSVAAGNDPRIIGAEQSANRNQPNGYAGLDANGTLSAGLVQPVATQAARSIAARLADAININDYNLARDGIVDDSPKVARAVADASAAGRALYIPAGGPINLGGAAQITLNNVTLIGDNIADAGFGTLKPAGPNATPQLFGQCGSCFFLTDRANSPFLLGHNTSIMGLNFLWPDQIDQPSAPIAYPALFTQIDRWTTISRFTFINCQVTNAFDFLSSPQSAVGNVIIANSRFYCVRYAFTVPNCPAAMLITNCSFSFDTYGAELQHFRGGGGLAGAGTYLTAYTATNGAWLYVTGDGTPLKLSSTIGGGIISTNNYILGCARGIWLAGGYASIMRITNTSFDQVPTVLQVDPGSSLGTAQFLGGVLYPMTWNNPGAVNKAFIVNNPSPNGVGQASLNLTIQNVEFGFANGPLFSVQGVNVAAIKVEGIKALAYGHAAGEAVGAWAMDINAPNASLEWHNNLIFPQPIGGNGIRIGGIKVASLSGNVYRNVGTPIDVETASGTILIAGETTIGTTGSSSLSTGVSPGPVTITVGGGFVPGDVATITGTIAGNANLASYKVQAGDTNATIAVALQNAVNTIAAWYSVGVFASAAGPTLTFADPQNSGVAWSASVSDGSAGSLSLGSGTTVAGANVVTAANNFDKPNFGFDPFTRSVVPGANAGVLVAGSSGNMPGLRANGGTNSSLLLGPAPGTGSVQIMSNGLTTLQMKVKPTTNAVNFATVTGGVAGSPAIYSVDGSDNNGSVLLTGKNTGTTQLGSAGASGSAVQFLGAQADKTYWTFNPVNGGTVQVPANVSTVQLTPTAALTGITVVLPAAPTDGQLLFITSTQPLAGIVLSPAVPGAPAALAANSAIELQYQSGAWRCQNGGASTLIGGSLQFAGTGTMTLPNWTTATRPTNPQPGMLGYASDNSRVEHYSAGAWRNWVRLDGDTMTGSLTVPALNAAAVTIAGGSINGTSIGDSTPAAVTASNLAAMGSVTAGTALSDQAVLAGSATGGTQPLVTVRALGTDGNVGIGLVPLGTGPLTAAVPDGTAAGGNARGTGATDWQTSRTAANQVASGAYAVIIGGQGNSATGTTAVAGGCNNISSGLAATVFGQGTVVTGNYSAAPGGLNGADRGAFGKLIWSSGKFATGGDSQIGWHVLRASTASTSAARLTADGNTASSTNSVPLPNNSAYLVSVYLVGRDTTAAGNIATFILNQALVTRGGNAASTAVTGNASFTAGPSSGSGTGMVPPVLTADTVNGCLNIAVTPPNADAWHWVARVESVEVV